MKKLQIEASTWAILNRLLDTALEQPAEQLDAWVENLSPDLDALKPRLRELLSRSGLIETDEFLHTLPKIELEQSELPAAGAVAERAGDEIGPYRLLRELGSGGMGVVWLAQRADGLISRPVALKLPHGAWKRAGLAERMVREREILAALSHPNIAHLYDAGMTGAGQPYLAIEYVDGQRIDHYCQERQLDVRARLLLFAQVARAVAFAHGKLVVHSDLKPANILVSRDGVARLLDFGIARLLDDDPGRVTRFTEASGRALTPDYASPEQLRGDRLTIATDVYSLGVILYELLSGRRPHECGSRGALEEAILHADPALPSQVAGGARRRQLRGDLDTVVLKALRKQAEERYATAHALLGDVERYLEARPVLAQPDSRWYRARRFIARNRVGVGAAAGISLALLIGAGVAAWQARVAVREGARAEEVKEFIASIFREADPNQGIGRVLSAPEMLRQAERRLRARADASPDLRLELMMIIGESLSGLQEYADSARVLEEALRLWHVKPDDGLLGARLYLGLSRVHAYSRKRDESRAELDRAFALLKRDGDRESPLFIEAKQQDALLASMYGDFAAAEKSMTEAIATATKTFGPRSAEVATGHQGLSQIFGLTDRVPLAVEHSRQAFDLMLAAYDGDLSHPKVLDSAHYFQTALMRDGKFHDAAALAAQLTARAVESLGPDSRMVGDLNAETAAAQLESGELRAAIATARRALEIIRQEADPEPTVLALRSRLLGYALLATRAGREALDQLDESVRLSSAAGESRGILLARAHFGLALARTGRLEEAERELRSVVDEVRPETRVRVQAMRYLATTYRLRGRHADALSWLDLSIEGAAVKPLYMNDLAMGLTERGLVKLDLGDARAAEESLTRAEALFRQTQGDRTTPDRADARVGSARLHMSRGEYPAALPLLREADAFWREFDAQNRGAGEAALWLGRCLRALGREAEARDVWVRATKLLAASPIPADRALLKSAHDPD